MKNFRIILAGPILLVLTLIFILSAQAQDTTISKMYMSRADQEWSTESGFIIAYHEISIEHHPWEDLEIFEISAFIDESIKNGTLVDSSTESSNRERLNFLKDKINTAEDTLNNGSFEETCEHLLEAYLITDGFDQTPDIVSGKAAPELAKMIEYMRIEIIGCE